MYRKSISVLLLSALLLTGCDLPFGTKSGEEIAPGLEQKEQVTLVPGLEARLFGPDRVAPGDSFRVRFHLENNATSSIRLQTDGCWGRPAVFFGEERVPLVGSLQVCTSELLTWQISAKDTRTRDFDLKATMNDSFGGSEEEGPAEPGTYTLQVKADWSIEGRKVNKVLKGKFEIEAP